MKPATLLPLRRNGQSGITVRRPCWFSFLSFFSARVRAGSRLSFRGTLIRTREVQSIFLSGVSTVF
jgi:hypothetical protein